ncbi:MAG: hypothetical protein IJO29_03065 [Oscillospiraceae bacterium]|nr:hypothetical protein [Oscillospiraceae bacterium]
MNTRTVKIVIFVLSLFIVMTVFSQAVLMVREEYVTVAALPCSSSYTMAFDGVYVRNEEVIASTTNSGVISYVVDDGGKVGVNTAIAEIYASNSNAEASNEIEKLEHELELLVRIQNQGTIEAAQPNEVADMIDERYQSVMRCIETNDLEALETEREELFANLCTMQIITGEISSFDDRIEQLQSQISVLNASMQQPLSTIYSDKSGFFVSKTDGFEESLNIDMIDELEVSDINEIIAAGETEIYGTIGKVINGLDWKMVAVVDNSEKLFEVGDTVNLNLMLSQTQIEAQIENIRTTSDFRTSILVLTCDKISADLVSRRIESVEMTKQDVYEGIKIPRETIRFSDGEKGVYVVIGEQVKFKKINIIFEQDDYVISEIMTDSEYVAMYDDIVLEGVGG